MKIWDDYNNSIQLNERPIDHQKHLSENLENEKFNMSDLDKQLNRVRIREANILDSQWVSEQKKKIMMQQELQRKMAQMLFNKGSSQLAKDHSKSDATKTLAIQLLKLREMAQGLKQAKEDDERIEKLKKKKKELDRQNQILEKVKESENIAILARFSEINQTSRIETVKLPQIYQNKNLNQRADDGYELLRGF